MRLIFIVFHGKEQAHVHADRRISQVLPLVVLMILSTAIGAYIHPPLAGVLPPSPGAGREEGKHALEIVSIIIACGGIAIAYLLFAGERQLIKRISSGGVGRFFTSLWKQAWGFDVLYHTLFVKPFRAALIVVKRDLSDYVVESFIPSLLRTLRVPLVSAQNGQIRWYAAGMALGVAWLLAFVLIA